MKRKPLQGMPLAQVLSALAQMDTLAFEALREAVHSIEGFDQESDRVEPLSVRIGLETDSLRLMLEALAYLYGEIHSPEVQQNSIENSVEQILDALKNSSVFKEHFDEAAEKNLSTRLVALLDNNENIRRSRKIAKARKGFIYSAKKFKTYIDMRPILSEDRQSIECLVPIVQFQILSESSNVKDGPIVFQLDSRGLKNLKEAVDAAVKKLDVISRNESISNLIIRL